MGRLTALSDRDLDRIIAGEPIPQDPDAEHLASFVRTVRGQTLVPPAIEALHLTAVVEAARPFPRAPERSTVKPRSGPRLRRVLVPTGVLASMVAKMAAATAAGLTAVGGLTVAGVISEEPETPPGIEETQAGEEGRGFFPAPLDEEHTASERASDTAREVLGVIDGWLAGGYATGCEFGQAVASAAGGQPRGGCPGAGQVGSANGAEGRANAEEKSAAGKAKGAEASSKSKTNAEEKSAAGKARGAEASSNGEANAPGSPPSGGGGSSTGGGGGSDGAGGGGGGAPPAPGRP